MNLKIFEICPFSASTTDTSCAIFVIDYRKNELESTIHNVMQGSKYIKHLRRKGQERWKYKSDHGIDPGKIFIDYLKAKNGSKKT